MANKRAGSNVQELGVCHPIPSAKPSVLYLVEPIDMKNCSNHLQNSRNT
jgi:hypothetical protein